MSSEYCDKHAADATNGCSWCFLEAIADGSESAFLVEWSPSLNCWRATAYNAPGGASLVTSGNTADEAIATARRLAADVVQRRRESPAPPERGELD